MRLRGVLEVLVSLRQSRAPPSVGAHDGSLGLAASRAGGVGETQERRRLRAPWPREGHRTSAVEDRAGEDSEAHEGSTREHAGARESRSEEAVKILFGEMVRPKRGVPRARLGPRDLPRGCC